MVSRRLSREEKTAATREALLVAASVVFARDGLESASIEEICEHAGFSRGAFYHHFSSKQTLFLGVLDRRTNEVFSRIATAFTTGATTEERITSGAHIAEQILDHEPIWCQLYYEGWLLASRDETFRALYAQRYASMRNALAEILQFELSSRGAELGLSFHELAGTVLALFEGYALQHVLDPHALDDRYFSRVLSHVLDSPVRTDPSPP